MEYHRGDIVKLDVDMQEIVGDYVLYCPFVKIRVDYSCPDELNMSQNLWAYADFIHLETQEITRNSSYYFRADNSILVADARPIVLDVNDEENPIQYMTITEAAQNEVLFPTQYIMSDDSSEWIASE